MKILLSQEQMKQIIGDYLQTKLHSDYAYECTGDPSYSDWTWEEMTPDYLDAKAKHEAEMEEYRKKWAAEWSAKQEAEAAAKFAIDNAVTGNKS